ncbi:unnamed protein product [Rotaria sp. Silwood1]|nr:unnamed protein product [Rotaria sp. Silwood1]
MTTSMQTETIPPTTTGTTSPTTPAWNESDYQSNSEYYESLSTRNFNQSDNLRLDRFSSPQFHPIDGRSIIYLRRQSHMPDLRGSTTTLHWLDITTNTPPVRLTRPIWGIHDQQVRIELFGICI